MKLNCKGTFVVLGTHMSIQSFRAMTEFNVLGNIFLFLFLRKNWATFTCPTRTERMRGPTRVKLKAATPSRLFEIRDSYRARDKQLYNSSGISVIWRRPYWPQQVVNRHQSLGPRKHRGLWWISHTIHVGTIQRSSREYMRNWECSLYFFVYF